MRQLKRLIKAIKAHEDKPVILSGDLNMEFVADDPYLRLLKQELHFRCISCDREDETHQILIGAPTAGFASYRVESYLTDHPTIVTDVFHL